jgi:hypothetical protein
VPQLPEPIVCEPELIVTERAVHVELLLRRHADLQLVLGPRIRHDLPVVHAIGEWAVRDECAEVVVGLVQEGVSCILGKLDFLRGMVRVPGEIVESVRAA